MNFAVCLLVLSQTKNNSSDETKDTLPGPEGRGGDGDVLGLPHSAGQVVGQVRAGRARL